MESTQEPLAPSGTRATQHLLPADVPRPPARRWIPIRSLTLRHRPRILSHLQALPAHDRYLRFGFAASDAQIARYADLIDFTHDDVFGVFNRRLDLIALAHLASLPDAREAEFGVSVLPCARGRGYGSRLFDRATLEARNRGVDVLMIHALAENTAMLRIARGAGAIVEREGGDTLARLRLPPDDLRSHLDAFFESSAAEVDFHLKAQRKFVNAMLASVGDISQQPAGNTRKLGE